jgi:hypothetical protein
MSTEAYILCSYYATREEEEIFDLDTSKSVLPKIKAFLGLVLQRQFSPSLPEMKNLSQKSITMRRDSNWMQPSPGSKYRHHRGMQHAKSC